MSSDIRSPDEVAPASDDYKESARLGYLIVGACIGIVLIWSIFAKIDSAVVAPGQVVLDGRRQVIQHLEGGIVSLLRVKEGQFVNAGDVLVEIDDTEARAGVDILVNEYDFSRAQEARLMAEIKGSEDIEFPDDLLRRRDDASVAKILNDETEQFTKRSAAYQAQLAALRSRETLFKDQIEGLLVERESVMRQLELLRQELPGVKKLAAKGLVPKQRWLTLERDYAQLEGSIGRNAANEAVARSSLEEVSLQILQVQQKRVDENYPALSEVRQKIEDLKSRLTVTRDRVRRSSIVSPKSGVLQNVRVSSLGQVVRPGDLLMELVPTNADLTVDANVSVIDIDSLSPGLKAEVRFPSFSGRDTPVMFGSIRSISKDRLVDEKTGEPFFLARIEVSESDIPEKIKSRLQAGMPAEVIVPRGERTFMEYLIKPLGDAFRRTFREE